MGKKRAPRGSVKVSSNNGSLRLRWNYKQQRYTLQLGLRAGHPIHEFLAGDRALWLERRIKYGEFDPDKMDYYRAVLHGEQANPKDFTAIKLMPLDEIWRKYIAVRRTGKSPATLKQYRWTERHISRLPTQSLEQPQTVLDVVSQLTPGVQKRLLTQFNACCTWAKNSGLITKNPFTSTASRVEIPKRGTTDDEIHPFSKAERDRVIEAFRTSRYYSHYTGLVSFLFFTGARPSEAIALRWRNVKPEYILFTESRVHGDKGCETKDGLKTQRQRRFPVNQQLAAILAEMQRLDADDLVFPSPKGISIRWGNFTTRAWNKVLEGLPDITHRNPYQTRHSFISHCKEASIPSTTIAEWVGNSATMIDQVYAKPTGGYSVPEL